MDLGKAISELGTFDGTFATFDGSRLVTMQRNQNW